MKKRKLPWSEKDKTNSSLVEANSQTYAGQAGYRFSFRDVLYKYIREPIRDDSRIIYRTSFCTAIIDAYPKASVHLLLLPHSGYLECEHGDVTEVRMLTRKNYEKLQWFHDVARNITAQIKSFNPHTTGSSVADDNISSTIALYNPILRSMLVEYHKYCTTNLIDIQIGYHAVPSLHPLHLHIIANDFVSDHLKTKVVLRIALQSVLICLHMRSMVIHHIYRCTTTASPTRNFSCRSIK